MTAVALRKESVDRNSCCGAAVIAFLSVALRKESVDRNSWHHVPAVKTRHVALRKESVDRNWQDIDDRETISGRSPQGERG